MEIEADKEILKHVREYERHIFRSISWVSIGIAILYISGYMWRTSYYKTLGVPFSFIDFPFPLILVPKNRSIWFIMNFIFVIGYEKYYRFYTEQKRLKRAKKIGISAPLEIIHEYAFQNNVNSTNMKNYEVFKDKLDEYINSNSKKDPNWKFDKKDFTNQVIKLFPDISNELENSFISYCIELHSLSASEYELCLKDVYGWPPEGSNIYKRVQIICFFLMIILFGIGACFALRELILTLVFMGMGLVTGFLFIKVSQVPARWQMWHMSVISFAILATLNGLDGYFTAKSNLRNKQLPIVTISQTNGTNKKGILLGSFSDGYVILSFDPNDIYRYLKIHKHEVLSVSWYKVSWMKKYNQQVLEELREQEESIPNKSKESQSDGGQKGKSYSEE